ncbi:MAG: hypothetical protein NZ572_06045, partial [Thermoflexus sp.]|nr:hypothetical protein [Thermoflexus sp.]
CSRLALIHNGRLILQGAPTELKAMADMGRVLEIAATPLDRALALLRGWSIFPYVTLHGARIHVYLRAPEVSLEEIRRRLETAGLESISVEPVAPSLEDIFLWVIERERFDPAG